MMRIIALLSIAACAGATSVQAQEAQNVVVQHGEQGYDCHAGAHYGCCEKDVSHCFDLWSTYCQERRTAKACSPRRTLHAQSCGNCGLFDFKLGCGPKLGHCESICDEGCDTGCETSDDCVGSGYEQPSEQWQAPGAADPPAPPAMNHLDPAEDIEESPSDRAPGADPPLPPEPNDSAGRWYLPFKWKN